jgi:hypothetical protein
MQDIFDYQSDSEPDVSQYQAEVCPSFQKVSLVNTNNQYQSSSSSSVARPLQQSSSSPKLLHLDLDLHRSQKIPLTNSLKAEYCDDDSSPDELSDRGDIFPDDLDDDCMNMNFCDIKPSATAAATTKPTTSMNGNLNECELFQEDVKKTLKFAQYARFQIPEYSAVEESRNVRNFHSITLPDGKTREIDMKVVAMIIICRVLNKISLSFVRDLLLGN